MGLWWNIVFAEDLMVTEWTRESLERGYVKRTGREKGSRSVWVQGLLYTFRIWGGVWPRTCNH